MTISDATRRNASLNELDIEEDEEQGGSESGGGRSGGGVGTRNSDTSALVVNTGAEGGGSTGGSAKAPKAIQVMPSAPITMDSRAVKEPVVAGAAHAHAEGAPREKMQGWIESRERSEMIGQFSEQLESTPKLHSAQSQHQLRQLHPWGNMTHHGSDLEAAFASARRPAAPR